MEMVMKNGFAELSASEMEEIDGGIGWAAVVAGILIVGFIVCCTKGCADADAGK